jgi:hypothetical protein
MDGKAITQDPMHMTSWSLGMACVWILNPSPEGSERLWNSGFEDALLDADDAANTEIQNARATLINVLISGAVAASGLRGDGVRVPIPALEWEDMALGYDLKDDEGLVHLATSASGVVYTDILVSRADVLKLWPEQDARQASVLSLQPESAHRAAIAEASKALWNGDVPSGISVQKRDDAIIKYARENGLTVPSTRTIRRYFQT